MDPVVVMIHLRDETARKSFAEWFKQLPGTKDIVLVHGSVMNESLDDALQELKEIMKGESPSLLS